MVINFSLFFLAAFSVNATLHLGLGLREIFYEREERRIGPCFFRAVTLFVSALLLWHFFVYAVFPLTLGFLYYFLLFPLCFLLTFAFESAAALVKRRTGQAKPRDFSATVSDSFGALAALILMFKFAINSIEALLIASGFAAGLFVAVLALKAIRVRIAKENIPRTLRGLPLMFISLGLLSLVFTALASIILAA